MSLVSDSEYVSFRTTGRSHLRVQPFASFLIHSIRLSYLRNVEDPYGPRLISLSPSYNLNPYINAASLADANKWPELAAPVSPHLSEDDGERPSGFPGATGLRHTQTIMGAKSGAVGLRVSGSRRSSSFNRLSRRRGTSEIPTSENPSVAIITATNPAPSQANPEQEERAETNGIPQIEQPAAPTVQIVRPSSPERDQGTADVPANPVQFIPRFKGAAEMEARRRVRMLANRNAGKVGILRPAPLLNLNPELSSSSSSSSSSTDMIGDDGAESSDELDSAVGESVDDEFDP